MKLLRLKSVTTKKGFTLAEILLVIAIVGAVTGFTSYGVSSASKTSRDANRKNDAEAILHALASYAGDHDWSFNDMVGTFPGNCNSPIADEVDTDGIGGDDRCQAVFYSAPNHPSGDGRNNWSVLQTYLQPYIGNLPVDPKNKFNSWNDPFPNYAGSSLKNGYYMVTIVDQETTASSCGMTLTTTHYFETPAENTKDPLTNGSRFPTMDNSNPACQGFRTVITLPGQI